MLRKRANGLKLRNKLILFYIPFLLIPIIALGSYLTVKIQQSTTEQSIRIYQQSAKQLQDNILNKLNEYYSTAYDIADDSNVKQYLNMRNGSDIDLYQFYSDRIMGLFSRADYRNPDTQIHIYTSNNNLKFSGTLIRDQKLFNEKKALVKDHLGTIVWSGIDEETDESGPKTVKARHLNFLMPVLVYGYPPDICGVLEMRIDIANLKQFLSQSDGKEQNIVLLTNGNNQPIVSNTDVDTDLRDIASGKLTGENDTVSYKGRKYLLINNPLEDINLNISGWKLTNLIPLDAVYQNTVQIQQANTIACVLCILIAVPLLILLSRTMTKRLEYLVGKMDTISRGEYNVSVVVPGNDEIAELGRKFDQMLQTLNLLTRQEMEAKLKEKQLENAKNEARVLALESQINPHYLFNTLESIRMSLVLKGDTQTADLIQTFAKSFRTMIEGKEQFITMRSELAFIRDYFTIQNFCYDGKIHLHEDVPVEFLDYRMPKFLLQPLVENAIYHGLELKDGEGNISVSASAKDGLLFLCVWDDGVGMKEEELQALQESLNSEKSPGKNYALKNIVERLSLIYGKRACLTIWSKQDCGTSVQVRLPLEKLEVEQQCTAY